MGQVLDLSFYRLKIDNENHERVCFSKAMTTQIQDLPTMDNSNTIWFISALTEHSPRNTWFLQNQFPLIPIDCEHYCLLLIRKLRFSTEVTVNKH